MILYNLDYKAYVCCNNSSLNIQKELYVIIQYCLLGGHVKTIAKALIACKELGDQVDTIKYDIEQGDFISAGVHAVHLIVMIFSIMAQCFTGETLVATDEGLIAIEDIEVGDYVLAEDTVTGEQEYKEVLDVFVSQTNKLVHVTTADKNSETNTETTITTTDNHPFYVEDKGWVPAIELEAGDELRTANGEIETVSKVEVEYLDEAVLIYNLAVEGYHTYFVSDESVLVHNTYKSDGGDSDNSSKKVNETNSAERQAKKLSPEARRGYDKAIEALETGDTRGLNAHPLSGNRSGQYAIDIKGTGRCRGKGRIYAKKE